MMAKKEKEMPKENTINIFGKEYTQKDLDALTGMEVIEEKAA
jgi:hypothetical protein